jgi:secreted PhoX family phosphatase
MDNPNHFADETPFDDYDEHIDPRPEETDFDRVVEAAMSRRGFMGSVLALGSFAALGGALVPSGARAAADRFAFEAIPANTLDDITVPPGFTWEPLIRWGDPITADGPEFDPATRGTGESQAITFGDNTDGMDIFSLGDRTLLVVNNEYTNRSIIWGNRMEGLAADAKPELQDDDILKGMMAHGIAIVELKEKDGKWTIVRNSQYNRRITPQSEMEITGPAAGHDLMKTNADPTGTKSLGTWNNCGNGVTPWGTYLTCEENFNGYFSASDENRERSDTEVRYGINTSDWGYGWARIDERFDITKHPNEPHRAGYVVEIDPRDPTATPKKRTALGRFKHENAECVINPDGRLVIYMGDDERGEFIYRYVSDGVYAPGDETESLMTNGVLSVAKFSDDGTGEWIDLTPETTEMSTAEIAIYTRQAGSKVGATTMDRPEWIATNPLKAELYCALTNNKNRGLKTNAGGDDTPVGGANPREANNYGQIVRWRPNEDDHTAMGFTWDLYVLAGNPAVGEGHYAGSENVNKDNMFNSPDGLAFDDNGLLWIQTDGNYGNDGEFAGMGNNQMLAGDPITGEIRRFMVGPNEAEITGLTWSADNRTMFVGIQHPGERGGSHWPEGGDAVPRSTIIAVKREDGGIIG